MIKLHWPYIFSTQGPLTADQKLPYKSTLSAPRILHGSLVSHVEKLPPLPLFLSPPRPPSEPTTTIKAVCRRTARQRLLDQLPGRSARCPAGRVFLGGLSSQLSALCSARTVSAQSALSGTNSAQHTQHQVNNGLLSGSGLLHRVCVGSAELSVPRLVLLSWPALSCCCSHVVFCLLAGSRAPSLFV